jgi:hypothetical protein
VESNTYQLAGWYERTKNSHRSMTAIDTGVASRLLPPESEMSAPGTRIVVPTRTASMIRAANLRPTPPGA